MRPKNAVPSYLRHKATGRARVVINGRTHYLPGKYDSSESRAEYGRLIAEAAANHGHVPPARSAGLSSQAGLYVSELIVAYVRHVDLWYVKNGRATSEVHIVNTAMRPVKRLYGHTLANDFDQLSLEACRQALLDQHLEPDATGKFPRHLSRHTVNSLVARIRRMFQWASSKKLVPATLPAELATLPGLRKGRSTAKESQKVRPAREEFIRKSLEFMPCQVAAMVQLQSLTGMRPGEVVIMRTIDINMTGKIWEYTPSSFKTEHHELDRGRTVFIGPRAQEIMRPWLKADLEAYLFSPAEAFAQLQAERAENRKTKVWPSHAARYQREKKARGRRSHKSHYSVPSYRQAIERACEKAGIPAYRPNQIRHTVATKIKREIGDDAARVTMGHEHLDTTQHYLEKDMDLARQTMEKIG